MCPVLLLLTTCVSRLVAQSCRGVNINGKVGVIFQFYQELPPNPKQRPPSLISSFHVSTKQNMQLHSTNTALETMMDVTFVLEESGVTATVEVPCEADVAAAKEVACTALAVSPASVEMRIGTQVLEGTCRLQDTAFDAGVQVVLACPRFADIKCPAEYSVDGGVTNLSLSRCGTLCLYSRSTCVGGFDTETFETAFVFTVESDCFISGAPAISRCKTRCYLACVDRLLELALPGGEVLRKVDGPSKLVSACGSVVVSQGDAGVSVYDEDLTLLRSLSHKVCRHTAVSDCGGWVMTSSVKEKNARLWDVNTGEAVACVPMSWCDVALSISRSASVFAVGGCVDEAERVQLYDWCGAALQNATISGSVVSVQFTPCGKYLVVYVHKFTDDGELHQELHQYDMVTMSCVLVIPDVTDQSFVVSPCSRVVVFLSYVSFDCTNVVTRRLYPHNE